MSDKKESNSKKKETGNKIFVFMYDLSKGIVKQFSKQLTGKDFSGVWHTSIVVFGYEYFFSGGIQRMKPEFTPFGTPTKKIDYGHTEIPQDIFEQFLNQLRIDKYKGTNYNLFSRNCNHFTEDALQLLSSKSIPEEVKSLPKKFLETDLGKQIKPMVDALMGGTFSVPTQTKKNSTQSNNTTTTSSNTSNSSSTNTSSFPNMSNMFGSGGQPNQQMMSQMMQNPMIQNLMSNPDFMSNMLQNPMVQQNMQNNPMYKRLAQQNPMISQMMQNPQVLSQMMNNPMIKNMMSNPQMMNQMMSQFGMGGGSGGSNSSQGPNNPFSGLFNPYSSSSSNNGNNNVVKAFVDKKEVYRYKKSNVPAVLKKLLKLTKNILSDEDKKVIENLGKFLMEKTQKRDPNLIGDNTFNVLNKIITKSDEKNIYPALDLFRLLILNQKYSKFAIENKQSPLYTILNFCKKWKNLSMPTQLMILRVYNNLFSNNIDVKTASVFLILNPDTFEVVAEIITESLQSKLEGLRLTAVSLAANIALFISKNGDDEETQILCSMIEYLDKEKNADIVARMMLTIYRMLLNNSAAVECAKSLDFDFKKVEKIVKDKALYHAVVKLLK